MKRLWSIVGLFISAITLHAQSNFEIKESSKGFYIEHKVASKETFFAIGRSYNLHPQTIASYNSVQLSKGLSVGQKLRIPLNDSNFDRHSGMGVPVYYKTKEGETSTRISDKFGIENEQLKRWNLWKTNAVTANSKVIVGFLNTKEMPSLVVDRSTSSVNEEIVQKPQVKEVKPITEVPQKNDKPEVINVSNDTRAGIGFFKNDFEKQIRKFPLSAEQVVTSGVFKTTSGWQDAKYYMLIDKVEPGTIVKITNPINNKSVYAKVLYGMEGIRQNEGLDIRISNAAAAALEITDTEKFFVKVNY